MNTDIERVSTYTGAWTPDGEYGFIRAIDMTYGLVEIVYSVWDWDDDTHLRDTEAVWYLIEDIRVDA